MKVKLDENLPHGLVEILSDLGHDVDTVPQEQLGGRDDTTVWRAAQEADRFLITQDLDFSDIRRFVPGTHAGILLVRLLDPSRRALTARLSALFREERVEEWGGCVVVASERKLRIRQRP